MGRDRMEVMVPPMASPDFHFETTTSPASYMSAPSSPKPFGNPFDYLYNYTSAPTSPNRAADIYAELAAATMDWEESPGTPKFGKAFDFGAGFEAERGGSNTKLAAADELFDNGKIRPQKASLVPSSPQSPRPRVVGGGDKEATRERGRDRAPYSPSNASSSRSRRGSRSLSPLRGEGGFQKTSNSSPSPSPATATSSNTTIVKGGGGSRKWRLRDLLLFRSASEGRVSGRGSKDLLHKYTVLSPSSSSLLSSSSNKKRSGEAANSESSRTADNGGSVRRGVGSAASAHEIHYTANRAASEEMKKKTPLPFYRNGLFGFLHHNSAVRSINRGHNSHSFSRRQS